MIVDKFEKLTKKSYSLEIKCMSWEQLKQIDKLGIAIESHTVTHRKLENIKEEDVVAELKDSKEQINSKLKKEVVAFCYPAGSHNNATAELTRKAGYKIAFTTRPGIIRYPLENIDLFKAPRLSINGKDKFDIDFEIGRLIFKK